MTQNNCKLSITVQPNPLFHFRYSNDKEHGSLKGVNEDDISVQLLEYQKHPNSSDVIVICTIYRADELNPHSYIQRKYVGEEPNKTVIINDPITSQLIESKQNEWTASFPDIRIFRTTKKEKQQAFDAKLAGIRKYKPISIVKEKEKFDVNKEDSNIIKLCFEAFEKRGVEYFSICKPIFSDCIKHSQLSNIDWDCRPLEGKSSGDDELIVVWDYETDLKYETIQVRFYELNNEGNVTWEVKCTTKPITNHCKHSFSLTTPAYHKCTANAVISFELLATGKKYKNIIKSHIKQFTYKACPMEQSAQKRKASDEVNAFINDLILIYFPEEDLKKVEKTSGLVDFVDLDDLGELLSDGRDDDIVHGIQIPSTTTLTNPTDAELLKELKKENIIHQLIENNEAKKIQQLFNVIELYGIGTLLLQLQNDYGNTCLHIACYFGRFQYIEKLIKLGIDPSIKNNDGNTALHYAVEKNQDINKIIKILEPKNIINLTNDRGQSPLYLAVFLNKYDIAKQLIEEGNAAIDLVNPTNGNNILHLLVMQFNLSNRNEIEKFVEYLINKDTSIDLNVKNHMGLIPMAIAIDIGDDANQLVQLMFTD